MARTATKMPNKRDALPLAFCFVLALTCRVVWRSDELLSSDAADLASDIASLLCSRKSALAQLEQLLLFRLGGIQPLVVFTHGWLAKALDMPLEPTTWEWSTIIVSSMSSPLAFLVGRRFGGVMSGWAWAAFLAVSPIHIMLGRNLGAPWGYEIGFQLAILLLTERHLSNASPRAAGPLWCALAAYVWCGNQMLAVVPVVSFAFLAHTRSQVPGARLEFLVRKVLSYWALVPALSTTALVYCTFVLRKGHLYHALFEKRKEVGWYWDNFYSDLVHNLGYVPTWVAFAAILGAVFAPIPVLDRRRIPLVYALCYALPFVFLVSRATTLTRGYCVYSITGMLGLVALAPANIKEICDKWGAHWDQRRWRAFAAVLYTSVTLFLVAAVGASVYKLYPYQPLLGVKGFQGSYGRPKGVAAAAGFISRLSATAGTSSRKVFSDAYGGAGLEPPIMRLYFRLPSFVHYDAPRMAPWKAFAPRASEVGYAVIRPENANLVSEYFPGLNLAATIFTETDEGEETILLVYARDFAQTPVRLSAEAGVRSYAQSLSHFCADGRQ